MSAIQHCTQLKAYYQLKVKEGENKMLPGRFLWFMQVVTHNFYHIFHPVPRPRKSDESACCDRIAEATALRMSILFLPSLILR